VSKKFGRCLANTYEQRLNVAALLAFFFSLPLRRRGLGRWRRAYNGREDEKSKACSKEHFSIAIAL